mmetsp:Transcript_19029/g.34441  ORF Transcript_19029/g.34441 Transcript_19029/m.34441 type:complete len:212 (-) Transcript_19029:4460-5095(-)
MSWFFSSSSSPTITLSLGNNIFLSSSLSLARMPECDASLLPPLFLFLLSTQLSFVTKIRLLSLSYPLLCLFLPSISIPSAPARDTSGIVTVSSSPLPQLSSLSKSSLSLSVNISPLLFIKLVFVFLACVLLSVLIESSFHPAVVAILYCTVASSVSPDELGSTSSLRLTSFSPFTDKGSGHVLSFELSTNFIVSSFLLPSPSPVASPLSFS